MRFKKKTIQRLKEAGWYSNRRVDISQKLKMIKDSGCLYNQEMLDFLIEFDDLYLSYSEDLLCSFKTPASYFTQDRMNILNGLVGENSFQIGCFSNYLFDTFITESQRMFCHDEFYNVYKIGDCYDEGVEFIFTYGLNPFKVLRDMQIDF